MKTIKLYKIEPEFADDYNHGRFLTRRAWDGEVDDGGMEYELPRGYEPYESVFWPETAATYHNREDEEGIGYADVVTEQRYRNGEWVMVPFLVGNGVHELNAIA